MEQRFQAELSRFQKAIFADATAKRSALLKEEAQHRKAALQEKNDQLLQRAYQQLQAGTAQFEKEASTALSKAEREAKRRLLLRRQELTEEMFSRVSQRLEAFSKGPEYRGYLQGRLEELEKAGRLSGSFLQVRQADAALLEELTQGKGLSGLEISEDIRLGGFRCCNRDRGFLAEETLEAALDAQKEWFFAHSGLEIG